MPRQSKQHEFNQRHGVLIDAIFGVLFGCLMAWILYLFIPGA